MSQRMVGREELCNVTSAICAFYELLLEFKDLGVTLIHSDPTGEGADEDWFTAYFNTGCPVGEVADGFATKLWEKLQDVAPNIDWNIQNDEMDETGGYEVQLYIGVTEMDSYHHQKYREIDAPRHYFYLYQKALQPDGLGDEDGENEDDGEELPQMFPGDELLVAGGN